MRDIAGELAANQIRPPTGNTLREHLRLALTDHIAYIDHHADGFIALMSGGLGADPDLRAMVDELRWNGARRILDHLGVAEPTPPVLRTSMRGRVGYFDEIMLDRLEHRDVDVATLVELATATLLTALRTALHLDPEIGIHPGAVTRIENPDRTDG